MDKIANAVETSPQFQSHKRVLREMGWDEDRINKFLYQAMTYIVAANEWEKGNVQ
jgi:hypothetical protein